MTEQEWQDFIKIALKEITTRIANLECGLHDHCFECEAKKAEDQDD